MQHHEGDPSSATKWLSSLVLMHFSSLLAAIALCLLGAPWPVVAEAIGTTPIAAVLVERKNA